MRLQEATEVQRRVWPCILSGVDTVGIAPTGSGKTLAFVLPMAELLASPSAAARPPRAPMALVLVPTRELALQIASVCRQALAPLGAVVMSLHGGEARAAQRAALRGADALDV